MRDLPTSNVLDITEQTERITYDLPSCENGLASDGMGTSMTSLDNEDRELCTDELELASGGTSSGISQLVAVWQTKASDASNAAIAGAAHAQALQARQAQLVEIFKNFPW